MLALLPLISFGILVLALHRFSQGWRRSFLFSAILSSLWLVASTEILGQFHAITRLGLAFVWILACVIALSALAVPRKVKPSKPAEGSEVSSEPLRPWDYLALILAAFLVAIVGFTALVSAPNTWDAMEYHLPRVIFWAGNRSVHFYPTIDRQQLSMPPLSEYAMLHLYVLYGSDRLVNLVQWLGYLGSILGVTLITAELGGNRSAQAFAAVLGATVPTALLAASGAKNDNGLTFWSVVTVYLLLVWKRDQSWGNTLALAAAASLAVFSKGTAYVFLPPLFLACFFIWPGAARRRFLLRLPVLALLLLSVSGPLWVRNYRMTGSPLGLPYFDGAGPSATRRFANSPIGPAQAAAGVLRNISINLSIPSERLNAVSTRLFSAAMRAIGVDPSDDGQIFRAQSGRIHPFAVHFAYRNEFLGANQWDFLLFAIAIALYLRRRKTLGADAGWIALGIIGAFILFSVLLRWGPWNGKYQMPVFTLSAAFIAFVLARTLPPLAVRVIAFALILFCVPLATMNYMRPWISSNGVGQTLFQMPRQQTYFLDNHREYADSFIAAAHDPAVRSCHNIGLDATLFRFEYPMMAQILRENPTDRFEYLAIDNPTTQYADPLAPPPCAVICLGCAGSAQRLHLYGANAQSATYGNIVVFSNTGLAAKTNGPAAYSPQATSSQASISTPYR